MVCYECDIWGLTNGSRVLTKQEVWQQKILPKYNSAQSYELYTRGYQKGSQTDAMRINTYLAMFTNFVENIKH